MIEAVANAWREAAGRRHGSAVVSAAHDAPPRVARLAGVVLVAVRRQSSAAWPVSVEEDVVERRAAQPDVVDRDAGLVEVADDLDEALGAAAAGDGEPARVLVDACIAVAVAREHLAARGEVGAGRATTTSMRSPPTCDFSSSAVPRAMILPWSTTAMLSASSSASSRYCVVQQQRRARRAPARG